jgi:hypothetical protein
MGLQAGKRRTFASSTSLGLVFDGQQRNAPDRIRTCDLRFRRPTLYPTELQARVAGWGQRSYEVKGWGRRGSIRRGTGRLHRCCVAAVPQDVSPVPHPVAQWRATAPIATTAALAFETVDLRGREEVEASAQGPGAPLGSDRCRRLEDMPCGDATGGCRGDDERVLAADRDAEGLLGQEMPVGPGAKAWDSPNTVGGSCRSVSMSSVNVLASGAAGAIRSTDRTPGPQRTRLAPKRRFGGGEQAFAPGNHAEAGAGT